MVVEYTNNSKAPDADDFDSTIDVTKKKAIGFDRELSDSERSVYEGPGTYQREESPPPLNTIEVAGQVVPENHIFITKDQIPVSLAHLTTEELFKFAAKTRWKVDLRILIMLCWVYICNYLDRTNISAAKLGEIEDELNMSDMQFQSAISVLFVAYTVFQVPSNILFNRIGRPALFISVLMTLWGIISTSCGTVQNYAQLMAVRTLIGIVESGFFVCSLYYLSCWYTKRELAKRNAILSSGSLISGALAGLFSAAILKGMKGVAGLRPWRWCFIIEGAISVVTVPISYFILPDNPTNTKFLSQMEKDMVIWKLKMDVGEEDSDTTVLKEHNNYRFAFMLAIRDPKLWLITLCISLLMAASGVHNFFPVVMESLKHYNGEPTIDQKFETLALTAPPYLIAVVTTFCWSHHSDKTQERFWHAIIPLPFAIAGFVMYTSSNNTPLRYIALCLMPSSIYIAYIVLISWIPIIIPRPPLKRAVSFAIMNTIANTMHVWTPYLYMNPPHYLTAMRVNCGLVLCTAVAASIVKLYVTRLNKRIASGQMNWEKEFGSAVVNVKKDFKYNI